MRALAHILIGEPASTSPGYALKSSRAPREREVPYLGAVLVEHELRVLGRREPDIARHLAVELAGAPARVAEGEQALLRSRLRGDVAQDLRAHGERHMPVDVERAGAAGLGAGA